MRYRLSIQVRKINYYCMFNLSVSPLRSLLVNDTIQIPLQGSRNFLQKGEQLTKCLFTKAKPG